MNYVLAVILIIEIIINIGIDRDYLRPSVIFTAGFTYSSVILAINSNNWGYQISFKTLLLISLGQIAFFTGERLAFGIGRNRIIKSKQILKAPFSEKRNSFYFFLGVTLSVGLIMLRLLNIRNVISMYGSGQYILSTYRTYGVGEENSNIFVKFIEVFCASFSYYYFNKFCLLSRKYRIKRYKYLIIVAMYMFSWVLSTNRSNILGIIFITTLIWLFTQRMLNHQIIISAKNKRRIVLIFIGGLALFVLLGNLTGKTQRSGVLHSIAGYSAGSIPALDTFICSYNEPAQFGYYTFESFKRILDLIGINVNYNISYYAHGSFVKIGPIRTNIYTCFRNYIIDYGYIGSIVLIFLIGIIFGRYYKRKIQTRNLAPLNYAIYSILVFHVFFSFLTERIFSSILTATTLVQVIALFFLYYRNPLDNAL